MLLLLAVTACSKIGFIHYAHTLKESDRAEKDRQMQNWIHTNGIRHYANAGNMSTFQRLFNQSAWINCTWYLNVVLQLANQMYHFVYSQCAVGLNFIAKIIFAIPLKSTTIRSLLYICATWLDSSTHLQSKRREFLKRIKKFCKFEMKTITCECVFGSI